MEYVLLKLVYPLQYRIPFSAVSVPLHFTLHPLAEDVDVTNGTEVEQESNIVFLFLK
jgi:hypothetical protein